MAKETKKAEEAVEKTTSKVEETAAKAETPKEKAPKAKKEATEKPAKKAPAKKAPAKKEEVVAEEASAKEETPAKEEAPAKEAAPAKEEATEVVAEEVEFDWYAYENDGYSESKVAELNDIYEGSLNSIIEKTVVDGTVIQLTDKEAVINVQYKSEGVIAIN